MKQVKQKNGASRSSQSSQAGQAVLEAALVMPVIVGLSLMLLTLQWDLSVVANVEYMVNETARCEAIASGACMESPNTPQGYALAMAQNLRINQANLALTIAPCNQTCTVVAQYQFQVPLRWFPPITVTRTGVASVALAGGQGNQ